MITTSVDHYPKLSTQSTVDLKQARSDFEDEKISLQEYEKIQNLATQEVIAEQEKAGLDLITDGQIKWDDQQTYFTNKIAGFERGDLIRYFDTNFLYRRPVLKAQPNKQKNFVTDDFKFAQSIATKPLKAVIIGPYSLAAFCLDEYFHKEESFVLALATMLADEITSLEQAGATCIQINEPWVVRKNVNLELFTKALQILVKARNTASLLLYTWFGAIQDTWTQLIQLPVDGIGVDCCRYSENYEYLLTIPFPADKKLGFGIVDALNTQLESLDTLSKKIEKLAKHIPLDNIFLNPSTGLEYLPRDKAFKKLQLIATVKNNFKV